MKSSKGIYHQMIEASTSVRYIRETPNLNEFFNGEKIDILDINLKRWIIIVHPIYGAQLYRGKRMVKKLRKYLLAGKPK